MRLSGRPVTKGGRSAISRDLRLDFMRAKEIGVTVLVCCLNDEGQ